MKIYTEAGELLTAPDLAKGWLEASQRVVKHHPAVAAKPGKTCEELMPGTDGLYHVAMVAPAVPAKPAWDEMEDIHIYHPYTPEELAELARPTAEERLAACEGAIMELMLGGAANV